MCWQVSQVETLALSRQIYSYGILSSVAVAVAVAAAARAAAVVVAVAVAVGAVAVAVVVASVLPTVVE